LFPRKHNRISENYTFIQHSLQINHHIFVASHGDWFLLFVEGNEWWDLCAGPHVETTGQIEKKAIELESVAGAYWRGDEKNAMLQRIYGTAWESEEQLKAYIFLKEEAKRRDHRRLGQDLDLFSIQVF
jgi:threonyl-tRNA synthetase